MNIDIAEVRRRTGKTQAEFCKWLHIPKRTYEKWEQGESVPPAYVLELIEYKVFCTYMVSPAPDLSGVVSSAPIDFDRVLDLIDDCFTLECDACVCGDDDSVCHDNRCSARLCNRLSELRSLLGL